MSQPAPAPAQPRPYTPVQQPDPQPVQPDARTTRPPEQPLPTVDKTGTQTFSGDTTGTGIIKGFLGKMAPAAMPSRWTRARTSSSDSSAPRWPSCPMKTDACTSPARRNAACSA
ncbi:hypothetical protein NIA69_00895 [Gemmiger formicilis]|nr:hypothetical protein [Gemmiger formicilis]